MTISPEVALYLTYLMAVLSGVTIGIILMYFFVVSRIESALSSACAYIHTLETSLHNLNQLAVLQGKQLRDTDL